MSNLNLGELILLSGELILADWPLFTVPDSAHTDDPEELNRVLSSKVEELSEADREYFYSLADCKVLDSCCDDTCMSQVSSCLFFRVLRVKLREGSISPTASQSGAMWDPPLRCCPGSPGVTTAVSPTLSSTGRRPRGRSTSEPSGTSGEENISLLSEN